MVEKMGYTARSGTDGERCECFTTQVSEDDVRIGSSGFRTSFLWLACVPSRSARGSYAGGDGGGSLAAAVSFVAGTQLDERSKRANLLEGQVPHVFPVQPECGGVGRYALGT